jgi:hypothetical protein
VTYFGIFALASYYRHMSRRALHPRKTVLTLKSIATAVVLVLTLTGCASGPNAATRNIKKVTDGAEADSGMIKARDILIVAQPDGSGVLVGTIVNVGPTADQLTGITINGITATISTGSIALDLDKPAIFAGDSANASAAVVGLGKTPGQRVNVGLTFANAAGVTLDAIVREKTGIYVNVGK